MLLRGKTAVITGAFRGIGRETVELFAHNGANIWACALQQDAAFESDMAKLAREAGVDITPLYFDMGDIGQVKLAMKQLLAAKTPIDILLNIAGTNRDSLFHMMTVDSLRDVLEINLVSQLLITQYVTKLMVRQKSGSVISVSSITATDGNPGQVAYGASKAALIGATKTLATELGTYGIRVNAVAPGVIATDMTAAIPPKTFDKLCERIPMKRPGQPREVAGVLLYLASDLSSYVTGQVLRIDGGID